MVDGGHLPLALAYFAVTLVAGYACARVGIALERRPEVVS